MAMMVPYLKNPAPCERTPAGFKPLADDPAICPGQIFNSYGAWFQAHQPKETPPSTTIRTTKASSYWPFGAGVTSVIGSRNNHDILIIDNARSRGTLPYRPRDIESQRPGKTGETAWKRSIDWQSSPLFDWKGSMMVYDGL